jgi:uncharacterized Zn-finger protein
MPENQDKSKPIEVTAKDLPLHCPMPDAPLWARHPRVFLDVTHDGKASCPYCGAKYVFTASCPRASLILRARLRPARGGNAPVSRQDVHPARLHEQLRSSPRPKKPKAPSTPPSPAPTSTA